MTAAPAGALMNKTEARHYLGGISERTLDRLRRTAQLPWVRVGGQIMFDRDDLDGWIDANKTYRVEDQAS